MPTPSANRRTTLKIILPAIFAFAFFALTAEAQAANWYVNTSCPSSGNGRGPACSSADQNGAWNSMASMNANTYAVGDDIYFRDGVTVPSGTRITPTLTGSSVNQSIIGTYYNDSGTIGKPGGGAIINGNSTYPAHTSYQGLIHFTGKSYVTVQDFRVLNSGYDSIVIDGGVGNKILNNYTNSSWASGSHMGYNGGCPDDFVISGNTHIKTGVQRATNGWYGGNIEVVGTNTGTPCAAGTGGVVSSNILIDSNGEGIDIIKGVVDTIVENNTIIATKAPDIYFAQNVRRCTARNNLIYGYPGAVGFERGIAIEDEAPFAYAGNQAIKIHSNMIVNRGAGISIGGEHASSVVQDNKIFNNTIIDCGGTTIGDKSNIIIWDTALSPAPINNHIKNNLSWITSTPLRAGAKHATYNTAQSGIDFQNNLWSSAPDTDVRSASDPGYNTYTALTLANYLTKSTGWNTITPGSLSGEEFNLKSTAANSIDKGGWLTTITSSSGSGTTLAVADQYFSIGDIVQIQSRTSRATVTQVNGLNVTVNSPLTWTQGNGISLAYSGTHPDIGANEYAAGDTTAPGVPGGLSVR